MLLRFNYKAIHFFTLSFFGTIVILCLTRNINSHSVYNGSIVGIVLGLVVWAIDELIIYRAHGVFNSGLYNPSIDDPEIHRILGYRIITMWIYIVILIFIFLFFFFLS